MKKKQVTAADIAILAGVSRSTVSRVLNNYKDIPEETKKLVLDVCKDHGYKPNAFSQVLKGIPQKVIALYVYATEVDVKSGTLSRMDSPYVMAVISNFIKATKNHHYKLMVELIEYDEPESKVVQEIEENFDSKRIAAALFLGLPSQVNFIDKLAKDNYKIAVIDRNTSGGDNVTNIITDDESGGYKATKHLIENGFKNIYFLGGELSKRSARMRARGYKKAMLDNDLEPMLIAGEFTESSGSQAAVTLIECKAVFDSVVCVSDVVSHGFIAKMREEDPELLNSIGLIGFDNSPLNELQRPFLSSIGVDLKNMAEATIESVLNEDSEKKLVLEPILHLRESSFKRSKLVTHTSSF